MQVNHFPTTVSSKGQGGLHLGDREGEISPKFCFITVLRFFYCEMISLLTGTINKGFIKNKVLVLIKMSNFILYKAASIKHVDMRGGRGGSRKNHVCPYGGGRG